MYEFIRNTIKWKSDFEGKELTHKNINLSELRQKWEWYFKISIYFLTKQY